MLLDLKWKGQERKLVVQANRNAFYYVLDRETGEFLMGKPFAQQTWAKELDAKGRPILMPNTDPTPEGNRTCPGLAGATNWMAPSYNPQTGLFYFAVREQCDVYYSAPPEVHRRQGVLGQRLSRRDRREGMGTAEGDGPADRRDEVGFPLLSRAMGGHAFDVRRPDFRGRRRRLPDGVRRAERQKPVEVQHREPAGDFGDHVHGEWQAVRGDAFGRGDDCVRPAGKIAAATCEPYSEEYVDCKTYDFYRAGRSVRAGPVLSQSFRPGNTNAAPKYQLFDGHLHYLSFVQETAGMDAFFKAMMRPAWLKSVVIGMPVVKKWDESEATRPTYYLDNDSHTYWYSATDFLVARAVQVFRRRNGTAASFHLRCEQRRSQRRGPCGAHAGALSELLAGHRRDFPCGMTT